MPNRPAPDLSSCTVLVIDDHDDTLNLLRTFLEECNARVVGAQSAEEARAVLTTTRPDVILTDLHMPHESGADFLRWLRTRAPEPLRTVPVVGISASAAYTLPQEAALFTRFFSKPPDYEQVCRAVAELIPANKKKHCD